jgi:hypothetical protein
MEGVKMEGANHQAIELAWFISKMGLKNGEFCAVSPPKDHNLQANSEK